MKKLIISPHVDDEILGCGGIIDKDTTILYCGHDESLITNSWVKERPSKDDRLKELDKVQKYLGFSWTMLNNTVNHYNVQNLISDFEKIINNERPDILFVPNLSYNQDHKIVYDAAMIATRPHDINFFVKKIVVYEQPQVFLWNKTSRQFNPNYFIPIDIEQKIKAYELMESQVRPYRSSEMLRSLAHVRGKQSNSEYAEAFEIIRWIDEKD